MNTKLRYLAVFVAFTLVFVWCVPSFGQVIKGSITGSVIDPQGAVVSGAQVKAKNVDTGVVFTTVTDSAGLYRLNLLPVGTYTVQITNSGFKTATQTNVVVAAGKDSGLNAIKMTIGEASTTIEVSAAAPLIETTQAQVTNTFTGTTLNTFAGIQENQGLDRLALFVPGVVATRSDNFSNTNGVGFSSNGLRGRNNDQEIDGQNNNDNSVGGPGLFLSNTEFVGQYVLITNQFGPEYGRNAGSVVNVITKSGTNGWHGSIFGANRNSYTEALTNTQKHSNKPGTNTGQPGTVACPTNNPLCNPFSGPPRFNEEFSGGTIGGPVVKNKFFVFGGMDSDLFAGSSFFQTSSLTPTPAGLATLAACGNAISQNAVSIFQKFGPYAFGGNPSPTNLTIPISGNNLVPGCPGVQYGGVTRLLSAPFHGYDFVTRADGTFGGDTFTARYLYNRQHSFNATGTGSSGWIGDVPALSQGMLTSWTHNFSARMVNEARIGFTRLNVEFGGGAFNSLFPDAGRLGETFTNITFQTGSGLAIGPATNLPQQRIVNTWQGQDNWNYVLGKHGFKAGINWTYQRSPNIFLPNINGQYRFFSLGQFLGGCSGCGAGATPLSAYTPNRVSIAQGQSALDFREYDTFAYAGDDWKLGKNLTVNLGVTWTYYGQPANLFHDITAARESDPSQALWLQSLPLNQRTSPEIPAITNSWGPSVGFAYQPQWGGFLTGEGKTVIRGGYRFLYDPPFYNIFTNISSSAPVTFLQTISAGPNGAGVNANMLPTTPTGPNVRNALQSIITPNVFDPRTQSVTNISNDFGPDKVHSWSFGVEREITKNSAIEARYAGNHGYNLFQTVDGNPYVGTASAPGQLQAGLLPANTPSCAATAQSGPGAGSDVGRLFCGPGVVRTRNNGGFSDYHALQVDFRANNLFKQLTVRSGYTWAKTLDNVSEIFSTGTAGNTLFAAQNPFQTGDAERSISGLNIPHAWTILFTEQLPFFKEQHGFVGHVLGGWAVSSDYILASGQPYTPLQGNAEALLGTPFGNVYDTNWVAASVGTDVARPFFGNVNAPDNAVGVYSRDACAVGRSATAFGCSSAIVTQLNALPVDQLVSLNALNHTDPATGFLSQTVVPVTANDVHFIINSREAQIIHNTPFGDVPRNPVRDAKANLANVSVYKTFNLGERTKFEMHLTMNNAFNHFNFTSVVPNIEFAGVGQFNADFANPSLTTAGGRVVWIGGRLTF